MQSERVQALKNAVLEGNDRWTLLKMTEPDPDSNETGFLGDLRSSKEKVKNPDLS